MGWSHFFIGKVGFCAEKVAVNLSFHVWMARSVTLRCWMCRGGCWKLTVFLWKVDFRSSDHFLSRVFNLLWVLVHAAVILMA